MIARILSLALLVASASAFSVPSLGLARPLAVAGARRAISLRGGAGAAKMAEITPNVSFDTIAREWRCKWSGDNDKASLSAAQDALAEVLADVKKVKGVKGVQRVVCGGCLDFKVVTSLTADAYGDWEKAEFAPEEKFLAKLKSIDGVSQVETQTYTLMPM